MPSEFTEQSPLLRKSLDSYKKKPYYDKIYTLKNNNKIIFVNAYNSSPPFNHKCDNAFEGTDKLPFLHPDRAFYRFCILILSCFVGFGACICYDSPAPLQAQIRKDIDISGSQFMAFYSWYSWPNIILCFFGGYLIDKVFGIRKATFIFAALVFIGNIIFSAGALLNSYWFMCFGRFVFGVGGESLAVAQNFFAILWFKGKEINLVFGLQLSVSRLGSTVSFNALVPIYMAFQKYLKKNLCLGATFMLVSLTCLMSFICACILIYMDLRAERIRRNDKTKVQNRCTKNLSEISNFTNQTLSTTSNDLHFNNGKMNNSLVIESNLNQIYNVNENNDLKKSNFVHPENIYENDNNNSTVLNHPELCPTPITKNNEEGRAKINTQLSPCHSSTLQETPDNHDGSIINTMNYMENSNKDIPTNSESSNYCNNDKTTTEKPISIRDIKHFPCSVWLINIVCVTYYIALFTFIGLGIPFFQSKYELSLTRASVVNSIPYLVSAFMSPLLGCIVDRYGRNLAWIAFSFVSAIASHAMLAFGPSNFNVWFPPAKNDNNPLLSNNLDDKSLLFLNQKSDSTIWSNPSYLCVTLLGFSYSALASALWPLVSYEVPLTQLGTAYGLMQAFMNAGLAAFSQIAGALVDNFGYLFLEIFFMTLLFVGLFANSFLQMQDKLKNGVLDVSPSQREKILLQRKTLLTQKTSIKGSDHLSTQNSEHDPLLPESENSNILATTENGIDMMEEKTPALYPRSSFYLRNRYLSRIGAQVPKHVLATSYSKQISVIPYHGGSVYYYKIPPFMSPRVESTSDSFPDSESTQNEQTIVEESP